MPIRREVLADQLWPEISKESQRGRLRTALWRLGQGLPTWASGAIKKMGDGIALELPKNVTFTHLEFEAVVGGACKTDFADMTDDTFQDLDRCLRRYSGPLMEGYDAEWITYERQRFADLYCEGLERQIGYLRYHGRDHETIRACRKLLCVDPYREDIHNSLIGTFARMGRAHDARLEKHRRDDVLTNDLGVDADAEMSPLLPVMLEIKNAISQLSDNMQKMQHRLEQAEATRGK